MKKIIEYLPLLSICLLYFGFCNLYYYYKEFHIDIYSFTSSTDILLSFFPKIVLFTSLIYGTILNELYNTIKKPLDPQPESVDSEVIKKRQKKIEWWRKNIYYFVLFYYLPILLINILLEKVYHYKAYQLSDLNQLFDFTFLALIYIAIMIHEKRSSIFEKPTLVAIFLIIFIGQKIGTYRIDDAQELKDGKSQFKSNHFSFRYNDTLVRTSDSVLYVGETSTTVFLYNLKDSATSVYPFSRIEDLIIK